MSEDAKIAQLEYNEGWLALQDKILKRAKTLTNILATTEFASLAEVSALQSQISTYNKVLNMVDIAIEKSKEV